MENDPSLPNRTSLTVDNICSLLSLCLDATYLVFKGKVYWQIHGTATGSPVLVVVANLVMEDIEQRVLPTFHTHTHGFGRDMWTTHVQYILWSWWTLSTAI